MQQIASTWAKWLTLNALTFAATVPISALSVQDCVQEDQINRMHFANYALLRVRRVLQNALHMQVIVPSVLNVQKRAKHVQLHVQLRFYKNLWMMMPMHFMQRI